MNKPSREVEEEAEKAANHLDKNQGQLDEDGVMVSVSRQALDQLLCGYRSQTARIAELEAELSKCGKDNCMGKEIDGVASWVRKELLDEARQKYASAHNDAEILGAKLELSEHREFEMHKMALRMKGDLVEVERDLAASQSVLTKVMTENRLNAEALQEIADLQWQDVTDGSGPEDATPREKGLYQYVGRANSIAKDALAAQSNPKATDSGGK